MSNPPTPKSSLSRELALYRYSTALERGDFAMVAAVLQQAEQDAILARLLAAWDQHLLAESPLEVGPVDPLAVRQALNHFLEQPASSAASNEHEAQPPTFSGNGLPSFSSTGEPVAPSDAARPPLPHPQAAPSHSTNQPVMPPPQPSHRLRPPRRAAWVTASLALAAVVVLFALLAHTLPLGQTAHPAATMTATPTRTATPPMHGKAAYLIDASTGRVLYADQPHQPLPIAGTTEIMTALVAIEQGGDLSQVVPITQAELDEVPPGASVASLQVGDDNITLQYLLYGLLLPSGSDAAIVIAHAIAGSTAQFVALMNARAAELGLSDTHFTSPSGAGQDAENHSSVADLVMLSRAAMNHPIFAQIVQTQHYELPAQIHRHAYVWENTNQLLGSYPGADGVKTGASSAAGFGLVFSATRNGRHLIGAELGAPTADLAYTDATALLTWGFAPSGTITEFPLPQANSYPCCITIGPDGNLWFSEGSANGNRIGRITQEGHITEYSLPPADGVVMDLTAGPDDVLWASATTQLVRMSVAGQAQGVPLPTRAGGWGSWGIDHWTRGESVVRGNQQQPDWAASSLFLLLLPYFAIFLVL